MTRVQAESFFHIQGGTRRRRRVESVEEARSEISCYIEGYYNQVRLHSALGYKSPMEYKKELKTKMEEEKIVFCPLYLDHLNRR